MIMEMRKFVVMFVALFAAVLVNGQNGAQDPVLMTVDGKPVVRSEFEAIYKKNNKEASVTKEALDEYLELFINYKLKVREAEVLGMDTISKFRTELDGYRKQLARPYLIDRELNDALMREAYDRMQQEVRASHILIQVGPDASPEDTLAAWKRIVALRDRVMKGEDFAAVAQGVGGSEDPSAAKNGGDLGYFSALQMVYPFENGAFNTPVGQVSMPVRTRFGYHIIKVTDKRAARGQIKVAHIMLRSTDQDPAEKQANVEARIREIHRQVLQGEVAFSDAALKYSDDESSNTKGGELPMFGTGKMIEEFEDAAFSLKKDGDISAPVRTRYGWHIIKRLEWQAPPTYDAAKAELKTKIARDSRAEITRKAFIERLKTDYAYTAYPKNLKAVQALVDTTIFKKGTSVTDTLLRKAVKEGPVMRGKLAYRREITGMIKGGKFIAVRGRQYDDATQTLDDTLIVRDVMEGWTYDRKKAAKLTKPVFTITGRTYTQLEFLDFLEAKQRRERTVKVADHVQTRYAEFVDESLMAYEDEHLEEKHADFRMLMKEYRDGILLFELTDQKVWGRAVRDTAGLEAFYKAHEQEHMWPTRYEADLYICQNAAVAKQVRGLLKKGKRGQELQGVVNKTNPLALELDGGTYSADQKAFLNGIAATGLTADLPADGRVAIADVKKITPPTPKTLDETRGSVTAAYQDSLEKAWIQELRAKYVVNVDRSVLYSIK